MKYSRQHLFCLACGLFVLATSAAQGQFEIPTQDQLQNFSGFVQDDTKGPLTLKGVFTAATKEQPARLYLTAEIQRGWHTYSITMEKGGPIISQIKLPESKEYRMLAQFFASPAPTIHSYPDQYPGLVVEEHAGKVTWHTPIELAAGVDPAKLKISGSLFYQACDAETCVLPKDLPFVATLGQPPPIPKSEFTANRPFPQKPPEQPAPPAKKGTGVYLKEKTHATIRGMLQPQVVPPGGTVRLTLQAEPAEDWHVYPLAEKDPVQVSKPTLIVLTETYGWIVAKPKTDSVPIEKQGKAGEASQIYHEGPVTWTVELLVPADAKPGSYTLAGMIGYQACWPAACDRPMAAKFEAAIEVGSATVPGEVPLAFADGLYGEVAKIAADRAALAPVSGTVGFSVNEPPKQSPAAVPSDANSNSESLGWMLMLAFAGGFVLNFMPCVLPVIGLKVLSFVEQSGEDRKQIWLLNAWYSAGLISVFLVLATLAVVAGLGWGHQFTRPEFTITMTCLVFVFSLSFLGVWEIPIPGFVGTSKAHDLAEKEGPFGAFTKGVLTTILATPCTGPFMGTALIWAVQQPAQITYAVFGCLGLGMASPYLLIGAYPQLIRLLPRPGAWMETFKQLMGFVLLGTVVWLLTIVNWIYVVPTVAMMIGLWAACWWIGRTPLTAELSAKLRAWGWAAAFAGLIGIVSFNWLGDVMRSRFDKLIDAKIAEHEEAMPASVRNAAGPAVALESLLRDRTEKLKSAAPNYLPWQAFTKNRVELLKQNKYTVFIDFTASWCPTCLSNKKLAFNTTETRRVVDANNVVTLVADLSEIQPAIIDYMLELGNKSKAIPYYAIFPADRPNEPILFDGIVTQQRVIEELQRAGPSKPGGEGTTISTKSPIAQVSPSKS